VAYIAVATAIVFFIIGAARTPTKLLQVRARLCSRSVPAGAAGRDGAVTLRGLTGLTLQGSRVVREAQRVSYGAALLAVAGSKL
jgi:hypothetical protein